MRLGAKDLRDLWQSSRHRLAISSTQEWALAALHRAVTQCGRRASESGDTGAVLSRQLEKILQLVEFLGRTWEDGTRPDVAVATKLHQALRRSCLSAIPDLPDSLKSSLLQHPIAGEGLFDGFLLEEKFSSATDKSRAEKLILQALRSKGPRRPSSSAPRSARRSHPSAAFLGFTGGPGFAPTTRGRGRSRGRASFPSRRSAPSRSQRGRGGFSSARGKGAARHF